MDISEEALRLETEGQAFLHALQSGIAAKIGAGIATECEPKHLRVGINNALIETSAILACLVDAGVITIQQFFTKRNELLREEVARYEANLKEHYGSQTDIKLG